jgi:hypothetical protein
LDATRNFFFQEPLFCKHQKLGTVLVNDGDKVQALFDEELAKDLRKETLVIVPALHRLASKSSLRLVVDWYLKAAAFAEQCEHKYDIALLRTRLLKGIVQHVEAQRSAMNPEDFVGVLATDHLDLVEHAIEVACTCREIPGGLSNAIKVQEKLMSLVRMPSPAGANAEHLQTLNATSANAERLQQFYKTRIALVCIARRLQNQAVICLHDATLPRNDSLGLEIVDPLFFPCAN